MARIVILACLLAPAFAVELNERQHALETAWSQDLQQGPSPLKRVIALLGQMKAELVHEASAEAEMYDKMVCWCETNEKEKTKAIADAEALDKELTAEINSRAAKLGETETTITILKKQISDDVASLKEATSIREAGAAKFYESNKDLIQSITNVKNAINVLSKHNAPKTMFVQLDASVATSIRTVMKDLAFKQEMMRAEQSEQPTKKAGASFLAMSTASSLGDFMSSDAQAEVMPLEFAQRILARAAAAAPALLQTGTAPSGGSYQPASNQIFGILTTMKEEFEANLGTEQKDEQKAQTDFEAMSAAKSEQIAVGKEKLDALEGANADNIKALSDAKENLEMTREQRSKDIEFLQNLQDTCMGLDKQWALRSKTRGAETAAVSEAIDIITSDDSMDLLRHSVSFIQVDSQAAMRVRRSRAASSLRAAANSPAFQADDLLAAWHGRQGTSAAQIGSGPRMALSTLAVSVSLDSFTKIKEAMDQMTVDLKKEQEEEVKFKTYCGKEMDANEKSTYEKTEQKEDLEALSAKLTKLLKKLSEEIAAANKSIADNEVAILKASQAREGENAEFQVVVSDQRATQGILNKALARLKEFYKKEQGGALLQKSAQTPPVQFAKQKNNAGASPVIGMIAQIIEDSKALEAEAVAGETEAQASYEKFVKDSNGAIQSLSDSVAAKTKASAQGKEDLSQAQSDLGSTNGELESLALTVEDLHGECDWTLQNFAVRQKARLDEIEAIGQAKAILSGAK